MVEPSEAPRPSRPSPWSATPQSGSFVLSVPTRPAPWNQSAPDEEVSSERYHHATLKSPSP